MGTRYADASAGRLISELLGPVARGGDPFEIPAIWTNVGGAVRNIGRPGIAATAISALDNALWDLKARLLGVSLTDLLGRARDAIRGHGTKRHQPRRHRSPVCILT